MSKDPPRNPGVLLSKMQFPTEYGLFIAANLLDLFLTLLIIRRGGSEVNPFPRWFVLNFGKTGFIAFKLVLMFLVIFLTEAIARKRRNVARLVICFGILVMGVVAVSSAVRYLRFMQTPVGVFPSVPGT